jgi:hypothetical protein
MLCPPPRTESDRPWSRANSTAATTSAVPAAVTTNAGVLAIMPFHRRVAASKPSSRGTSNGPRRRPRNASTVASGSVVVVASGVAMV